MKGASNVIFTYLHNGLRKLISVWKLALFKHYGHKGWVWTTWLRNDMSLRKNFERAKSHLQLGIVS